MAAPRELTRMPYKRSSDRTQLHRLISDTQCGHVSHVDDQGEPHITPVVVARVGESLVWHGSTGATWMRMVEQGRRVAVALTAIDALVVGRTRIENSFWYRSAIIYGSPRRLLGPQQDEALNALTDHILPGRVAETRASSPRELAATMVLAIDLDDWILKLSAEWPDDPSPDKETDVWAGALPVQLRFGPPIPAPDLSRDVPVPPSCRQLIGEPT